MQQPLQSDSNSLWVSNQRYLISYLQKVHIIFTFTHNLAHCWINILYDNWYQFVINPSLIRNIASQNFHQDTRYLALREGWKLRRALYRQYRLWSKYEYRAVESWPRRDLQSAAYSFLSTVICLVNFLVPQILFQQRSDFLASFSA